MMFTDLFIIGTIALIAIVDVGLVVYKVKTVSNRLRAYGREVSFFPYMWGVLGGHFWGPGRSPMFDNWWGSIGLLVGAGLTISLVHFLIRRKLNPPGWLSLLYLPMGSASGVFFWPQ